MDPEFQKGAPEKAKNSSWKTFIVIGILVSYALTVTAYSAYLYNTSKTAVQIVQTHDVREPAHEKLVKPMDGDTKIGVEQVQASSKELEEENPIFSPEIDEVVREVLPEEDLKLVRKGIKLSAEMLSPSAVAMNAFLSTVTSLMTIAIVVFLGYLAYMSTQGENPLLSELMVKALQNYTRLATSIGSAGLLISALIVYYDNEKSFSGLAHVSAVFFALLCVSCCFFFTFAELAMNAQSLVLPDIHGSIFDGKTAASIMGWLTSFLHVNMTTLGSGLMIMWIAHFIAFWVLKAAEGTLLHKACSVLCLPMTSIYMSARRSAKLIQTISRLALSIVSLALTISLLTPD